MQKKLATLLGIKKGRETAGPKYQQLVYRNKKTGGGIPMLHRKKDSLLEWLVVTKQSPAREEPQGQSTRKKKNDGKKRINFPQLLEEDRTNT